MRGTTKAEEDDFTKAVISIHVPHAGNDGYIPVSLADFPISIHVPHAGNDLNYIQILFY
jgi:hypothetical protein